MKGIDVSHHNSPSADQWVELKKAGVDFAIIKVTEALTFNDFAASTNVLFAGRAGILVGGYHFAELNVDPSAQADAYWARVQRIGGPSAFRFGHWLDYEDRTTQASPSTRRKFAEMFVGRLKTHTPDVGWYMDQSYLRGVEPSTMLQALPLWIAAYQNAHPNSGWIGHHEIHQYDDHGSFPRVPGLHFDMNIASKGNPFVHVAEPKTMYRILNGPQKDWIVYQDETDGTYVHVLTKEEVQKKLDDGWKQVDKLNSMGMTFKS